MYTTLEKNETKNACAGSWRGYALAMLCGAAAGATVALLFAPKSGVRFRRDIKAQASQLKHKAANLYDDAAEKAADLAARGKDLARKVTV